VWVHGALTGAKNHPHINGKDGVAGWSVFAFHSSTDVNDSGSEHLVSDFLRVEVGTSGWYSDDPAVVVNRGDSPGRQRSHRFPSLPRPWQRLRVGAKPSWTASVVVDVGSAEVYRPPPAASHRDAESVTDEAGH
jgi:hypothetical protein